MNRMLLITLLLVLTASLLLNVYLWQRFSNSPQSNPHLNKNALTQNLAAQNDDASSPNGSRSEGVYKRSGNNSMYDGRNIDARNRDSASIKGMRSLSELNALLHSGDMAALAASLNRQLKISPLSEPLLLLEAELIRQTKPLPTALLNYYDLADLPLSNTALIEINEKIQTLYQQAQQQFSRSHQWELVAKLNEPLFQRVPDNKTFTVNLATAYAHQLKVTLMEDVLAALPFNDPDAQAIRDIASDQQIAATEPDSDTTGEPQLQDSFLEEGNNVRVKLERIGNSYHVNAVALNQQAFMILDTGASTTAISSNLYARLGKMRNLNFIGIFNVQTASGSVEAPLVRIPEFRFAGYTFNDVSAIVLPEEALPDADGLLGMNILGEFDFSILPKEDVLILNKR
ncbi:MULTISPECIES: retropepsin-like aspartic protease family protein [unclassified Alteromonas]|uniref:retropepsin-like aspartic protease family protein n=1 Tax=unclassified Alteromonas TaxID=2614992 RepID=UPI000509B167|nr:MULTISPECIES: retropepsin-like aspartic protease [unclassified Alteromonas]